MFPRRSRLQRVSSTQGPSPPTHWVPGCGPTWVPPWPSGSSPSLTQFCLNLALGAGPFCVGLRPPPQGDSQGAAGLAAASSLLQEIILTGLERAGSSGQVPALAPHRAAGSLLLLPHPKPLPHVSLFHLSWALWMLL